MTRLHARTLVVVTLALLASACGETQRAAAPTQRPAGPRLPHAVGEKLASESDDVATALAAGDCDRAHELALHLQRDTIDEINAQRVPPQLLEDLQSGVNVLVDEIQCAPPAPPTTSATTGTTATTATTETKETDEPPPNEHGHGKKKGHHKHGKGGGDEEGD